MMTKEQEREVLRKIVALIDSTEDGSYIKTAFYGCVRDAERNIDEDVAYSWYDRAQAAERKEDAAKAEAEQYRQLAEQYKEDARDNWNNFWQKEGEADALRQEVIELKAKLYDFMIKG